jgi:non-heme chloroperoxidase
MKWWRISLFFIASILIYVAISAALVILGVPAKDSPNQDGLSFGELLIDYGKAPPLRKYQARDGASLEYRLYPAKTNKVLILLHGSGWHSRYLFPLASYIASQDLAAVYTPDLRGHGRKPKKRGDIDYIGQMEDDLWDLMNLIRRDNPGAEIIIGGHSSGGGLAVRFAGSQYGKRADAYLLLAPFLKYNAPTTRPDSGGWAMPYTGRIIGLSMFNNIGVTWFNSLPVIEFNMPEAYRDGTETLVYSYRLNTAYAPKDYEKDLRAITQPLLVVAGTADESFFAEQYQPTIAKYTQATVVILPGVNHMGVVVGKEVQPVLNEWLTRR